MTFEPRFDPFHPRMRQALAALLGLATAFVSCGALAAQGPVHQFSELGGGRLPVDFDDTMSIALGDVDADGDIDVFYGNRGQQNRLFLNDGNAHFVEVTATALPVGAFHTDGAAFGDVDGDGDLDLVTGNVASQNRLYRNDGAGRFTDETTVSLPADPTTSHLVLVHDLDRDGDLDLIFGADLQSARGHRYLANDGYGVFTDVSTARLPAERSGTMGVAAGDVDADGDVDLVFANYYAPGRQNRLYLNDGTGAFVDATAGRLPIADDSTRALVLTDVDGDGDLDLFFANNLALPSRDRLYLNDGTGRFVDATAAQLPMVGNAQAASSVAADDIDFDGDVDLVIGVGQHPTRLLVNDGTGTFVDVSAARLEPATGGLHTIAVALARLDGDEYPDLLAASCCGNPNRLLLNLHRHVTTEPRATLGSTHRIDYYDMPGYTTPGEVLVPFFADRLAAAPIELPGIGRFWLDRQRSVQGTPFRVPSPGGLVSLTLAIPNDFGLVGTSLHTQALGLQIGGAPNVGFSNHQSIAIGITPRDLVANGSFEDPALFGTSWNVYPTIPGWRTTFGCGIEVQRRAAGSPLAGDQLVELDSHCSSGIAQDVPTTPGVSYLVSLGYSPRPGVADNAIEVRWDGQTLVAVNRDGSWLRDTQWETLRCVGVAGSATTVLELADVGMSNALGAYVDDVSVVEVSYASAIWLVVELCSRPGDAATLTAHLRAAAAAAGDPVAQARAIQAFVAGVHALVGTALGAEDAAVLVAMANAL